MLFQFRRWDDGQLICEYEAERQDLALARAVNDGWNLQCVDLRGLQLMVRIENAKLKFADLSYSTFRDGAMLRYCDLDDANLSHIAASGVDFSYSRLQHANLRGAQLHGCSFAGANLRNADFSNGTMTATNLDAAIIDGMILPASMRAASSSDAAETLSTWAQVTGDWDMPATATVTSGRTRPAPPPPRPRTVRDYCVSRGVKVRVLPYEGPLPLAGDYRLWTVVIKGKRTHAAVVRFSGDQAPKPAQAVALLVEMSQHVDNGRGDCKCGCGITPKSQYITNMGYRQRPLLGEYEYRLAVEASKTLRAVFGNKRDGYNTLVNMDRYHMYNMVDTW